MTGYKEIIEIDATADGVEIVDEHRAVDASGRISVGRPKAGRGYDKIILIRDSKDVEGDDE